MWSFQYKHGDRPLDGYTIQRAAGRGGFGEVYYAVSDAGREVALKVITGFEQIELRGISQCMNLKSPHLVTIFDVKQNAEGRSFVIMEYVSGPNLREMLDESPAGLGPQKAAFFLREIAKGLSYLHDCGIVHRDLKPANIFFENGYAKIGDYGLSKAIEPTHHSGQTVTVGTVHYMAPEVGCGKYDRAIDIYALGALLYEMLTGVVPFVGASAGEILIKHLSHEADCSGIPEPFCSAIKRAMAKDPEQRFATVQEMVEAVFGAEHVRNSVSQFSPQDLSMVAGRVAARLAATVAPAEAGRGVGLGAVPPAPSSVTRPTGLGSPPPIAQGAQHSNWVMDGGRRIAGTILAPLEQPAPMADTLSARQRLMLGILAAVVVSIAAMIFDHPRDESSMLLHTMLAVAGCSAAIIVYGLRWLPKPIPGHDWADRFGLAATGTLGAVAASAPIWMDSFEARTGLKIFFIAILAAMALANPRKWTRPDRRGRIHFGSVAGAGALAFAMSAVFHGNPVLAIAVVGGAALVVQVLAPWDERAAKARARAEGWDEDDDEDVDDAGAKHAEYRAANATTRPTTTPLLTSLRAERPAGHAAPPAPQPVISAGVPVPRWATAGWFCGLLLFAGVGVILHVITAVARLGTDDFAGMTAFALAFDWLAFSCFRRMRTFRFRSWPEYLILPAFRAVCISVVIGCWTFWGLGHVGHSDEEVFVAFITISLILWSATWLVPWLWRLSVPPAQRIVPPPLPASARAAAGEMREAVGAAVTTAREALHDAREAMHDAADRARSVLPQHREMRRARRWRRNRREYAGGSWRGLAGMLGGLLIFAGFLLALAHTVDVVGMIAAGVPDYSLRDQIASDVFDNAVPNWPHLVRQVTGPTISLLLFAGLLGVIVGRLRVGARHALRAVAAVGAMMFSMVPLSSSFRYGDLWKTLAARPEGHRGGWAAVQVFVDVVRQPGTFWFLFFIAAAAVLFAWRPRRAIAAALPGGESGEKGASL